MAATGDRRDDDPASNPATVQTHARPSTAPVVDPQAVTTPTTNGEVDPYAATISPPEGLTGKSVAANAATFSMLEQDIQAVAASSSPPPEIPGYQIVAELGRGGMGVVYQAIQTRLHRPVALKMILAGEYASSDARVRFLGEAEVIAKLQHPNIVQLYEFNFHQGVPFFSLEFVDGGTLSGRLAKQPLPPGEAAALIETLARAVQHAHSHGVVHRDLKPGNILLQSLAASGLQSSTPTPGSHSTHRSLHGDASYGTLSCVVRDTAVVPKITDFGLAKSISTTSGLTQSGAVMGTPSYMAPEQAGGHSRDVGPAADTYALGAMLYECLTGRPPFQAANPIDTIVQVVHDEPVPPRRLQPKVPKDLETICLKCLHKDPAKRYATTEGLANDLTRYLTGESIQARPVGPVERTVRWAKRKPTAAALCAVTALLVATVATMGWVTSARHDRQRILAEELATEADKQRRAAEQFAADANQQRIALDASLRKRIDMVDDVLFNVDGRLANEPNMSSIREEFLDEARKVSNQILAENPDDPSVIRQAVRVHRSMAELTRSRRSYRESAEIYSQAIQLGGTLVGRFPQRLDYQVDLARSTAGRAMALWQARRLKDAEESFAASIKRYEPIIANPNQRDAEVRAARVIFYRANVLEELKKPTEAIAAYRDALARQEKLARESPKDADIREDLGYTATGLALAVEATDRDEATRRLKQARDVHTTATRLAPRSLRYATNAKDAFDDIYDFCQRHHRDADLATLAREYADSPPDRESGAYNAACYFSLAAKAAAENPTLASDERKKRADDYARQSVEYLDKAIEEGFTDRVHLLKDTDLDFLRERADYKAFLARLEKRFPGRSVTPTDLLVSLQEEFDGYQVRYERRRRTALYVAEKKRTTRSKPDFPGFANKMLQLAAENPKASAGLDAAVWVYQSGVALKHTGDCCDRALACLTRYADRPEFANACRALAEYPTTAGDALLRTTAANHKDRDTRGVAAFALGLSLAKQADDASPGGTKQARLLTEAEDQFEKVAKEFATVTYRDSTLSTLTHRKLHELRGLTVGRQAREIEGADLAGKPLRLSSFRGKVTLVMFWANWCGYCRQMFHPTRNWAEQYKAQPFAIVGINCDDEKPAADRAVEREKLAWPSWWDGGEAGGRISEQWQIDSFPTLYLIDHSGVIRHKWQGKPDPKEVQVEIDALLKKAAAGRS